MEETKNTTSKHSSETCALCGQENCDKKWAGKYWHKQCLRKMKKGAKGMF